MNRAAETPSTVKQRSFRLLVALSRCEAALKKARKGAGSSSRRGHSDDTAGCDCAGLSFAQATPTKPLTSSSKYTKTSEFFFCCCPRVDDLPQPPTTLTLTLNPKATYTGSTTAVSPLTSRTPTMR